ncbi:MAG: AI-2E family transporter [Patescibacteria group bacterium]
MDKSFISKAFLLLIIIFVVYACYLIFRPFLTEILAATIIVSIFYSTYELLVKKLWGRRNLAALVMCILVALLVIIPLANFIVYAAQKSVEAYSEITTKVNTDNLGIIMDSRALDKVNLMGFDSESIRGFIIDIAKKLKDWLVSGGTNLIKGTTNFIISLVIIIFTTFFFFVDGKKMIEKLMYWTPLSNKYDKKIFQKFRDVSHSIMLSTFVTAAAQGIIGAIGFLIVGMPAFFAGVAMAFLSLLPFVGAAIIWLPVGVYLLVTGSIWQGIFLLIWGGAVVSTTDNVLRAYIIKGKAQVHPIFIIFSVLGGIALFGFWGIIFGPLIISLAVTILHIYELEYGDVLEK